MAYYIEEDGKTVVRYRARFKPDGIALPDGRFVPDGIYNDRIFAVHPDENTRMRKNEDGVYEYLDDAKLERVAQFGAHVAGTWVSMRRNQNE